MERVRARRIVLEVDPKQLKADLERYRHVAFEAGADAAEIVPARKVVVDERVRMKCMVPRCHLCGESPNCPPYTPEPDFMRKVIRRFRWALVTRNDVRPVEDFIDNEKWHKGHIRHQRKTHDIVSAVESRAFNDGYYLAMGFAAGGCKTALCGGRICQLLDSGRCRFPLKARPSMEAVGIDAYRLATEVGWSVYPVAHPHLELDSIPSAISLGLVLVY